MQYTINFVGEDDYHFTAPKGTAQYDLGFCRTEAELMEAVNRRHPIRRPGSQMGWLAYHPLSGVQHGNAYCLAQKRCLTGFLRKMAIRMNARLRLIKRNPGSDGSRNRYSEGRFQTRPKRHGLIQANPAGK